MVKGRLTCLKLLLLVIVVVVRAFAKLQQLLVRLQEVVVELWVLLLESFKLSFVLVCFNSVICC